MKPQGGQRQPIQAGPVVLLGVVLVLAGFQQDAGLDGLIRFVAVHRALVQPRQANRQGRGGQDQQAGDDQDLRRLHEAGLPYTATSM